MLQQTLEKLKIRDWVGEDAIISVQILRVVRDFKRWVEHLHITLGGGLLRDEDGIHCFVMMHRKGAAFR
jgi:hypothetical protein